MATHPRTQTLTQKREDPFLWVSGDWDEPNPTGAATFSTPTNKQDSSPLYNGRIPAEIRQDIFKYVLAEYTDPSPNTQYPPDTNFTRPGYTGFRKVCTSLLQTCRRAYLEAYEIPMATKEHCFWHERRPPSRFSSSEIHYINMLFPWQRSLLKEIHFFTQIYWLENSFWGLCQQSLMQEIEKVKITIRRGDWWYNETNAPLGINPQRGNGEAVAQMKKDWLTEEGGENVPWTSRKWGVSFMNLKSLKELEMEFETSEDKVGELEEIVKHARNWRFPMREGHVLSTEGLPSTVRKWRGTMCYWSDVCPCCGGRSDCRMEVRTNEESKEEVKRLRVECEERMKLRAEKLGPMLTIISLRWKLAVAKEDEGHILREHKSSFLLDHVHGRGLLLQR